MDSHQSSFHVNLAESESFCGLSLADEHIHRAAVPTGHATRLQYLQ